MPDWPFPIGPSGRQDLLTPHGLDMFSSTSVCQPIIIAEMESQDRIFTSFIFPTQIVEGLQGI